RMPRRPAPPPPTSPVETALMWAAGALAGAFVVGGAILLKKKRDDEAKNKEAQDAQRRVDAERQEYGLRNLGRKGQRSGALWPATPPSVLYDATVANAEAGADGTIHVNREWFCKTCLDACPTQDAVCARTFAYWLLAHEVAHILYDDPKAYAALEGVPPW